MTQHLWLVLSVAAVALFWYVRRADLTGPRARELVSLGALLVDVRSAGEFERAHIPGATNVPVGEIGARTKELGPATRPVIVYCASGARSAIAKRALRAAGFAEVYNLGSMSNW
jgi:rhodanese-related sulfurtransferase